MGFSLPAADAKAARACAVVPDCIPGWEHPSCYYGNHQRCPARHHTPWHHPKHGQEEKVRTVDPRKPSVESTGGRVYSGMSFL